MLEAGSGDRAPAVGILEWFEVGEYHRVERVLRGLGQLGIEHLRTGVSWADWYTRDGERWYDWLIPRIARDVTLLPCVVYTPPSIAIAPKAAAPPKRPRDFADFLDFLIDRHGEHFQHVELWNEPNNIAEWDWRLDLEWNLFAEMIGDAAHWCRQRGKKTVLGGMSPLDRNWISLLGLKGALNDIDVIGIHGFPGTWEVAWEGWEHVVESVHEALGWHGLESDVWITEAGYSTWRSDEFGQVRELVEALAAPVSRIYWYAAEDLEHDRVTVGGFHTDVRHYHMGIRDSEGEPKLLARLWRDGGLDLVREMAAVGRIERTRRPVSLVTGGAGFVGTNLAHRLLSDGHRVRIFDNLARPGVERNLQWLLATHPGRVEVEFGDIRDPVAVRRAVEDVERVFHFAAQVAVTTSVKQPRLDFDVNALGTFRILDEVRRLPEPPPVLFTSTNKVYGTLPYLDLVRSGDRWLPLDPLVAEAGLGEDTPLDFCTPYGCSKGTADQYALDYAKTYGIPATVFRMSCIYGPHQRGTEDQGWVAHFLLRALAREPITIYGDGAQVRDILFVEDLVDAISLAAEHRDEVEGRAFNIGGGPECAVSLREVVAQIGALIGRNPALSFATERIGDQRYYVSDTSRFREATGWAPRVLPEEGLESLHHWLTARRELAVAAAGG